MHPYAQHAASECGLYVGFHAMLAPQARLARAHHKRANYFPTMHASFLASVHLVVLQSDLGRGDAGGRTRSVSLHQLKIRSLQK